MESRVSAQAPCRPGRNCSGVSGGQRLADEFEPVQAEEPALADEERRRSEDAALHGLVGDGDEARLDLGVGNRRCECLGIVRHQRLDVDLLAGIGRKAVRLIARRTDLLDQRLQLVGRAPGHAGDIAFASKA